ncbi:MAG: hypothetical protein BA864_07140 [Desulfuromonadales bacterium C00003093]|nr:MAG: hypothetical protein BA864_07140 [Desulfuromonadales bacterium C00003093]
MAKKLLCSSLLSLLLTLVFSSAALANKNLYLSTIAGQGTVYFAGQAISATGSLSVANNATVALKAVPASGYEFSHWVGNVANANSAETSIFMNNSAQIVAVVFIAQNSVTVNFAGSGSGNVTLSDGADSCTVYTSGGSCSFADNSTLSLTASPGSGSAFTSWSGVDSATAGVATLAVGTTDHTVTATFDAVANAVKSISLEFRGDGTGSVTLSGASTYTTTSNGIFTFDTNVSASVTLTATADTDIDFAGWSGDVAGTTSSITITLDSDKAVRVTFDDTSVDSVILGCGTSVTTNYSAGFDAGDFSLTSVSVVAGSTLQLETGNAALDPNSIVIPFEQEVSVTFLYEGAGYDSNDLGWLYATDDPATIAPRQIYNNINDNNNDGVLDRGILDDGTAITDSNGDGVINALDNRVSLGRFAAGTEIVFTLTSGYAATANPPTFYTKTAWNPDTWNGSCSGDSFTKTYLLGSPLENEGTCAIVSNWMGQTAIDRLSSLFSLSFTATDTQTLAITRGEQFAHVIVGTPADKPNEWVLGWEDLPNGGDTDHNDMIFQIERKTGGSAQLLRTEAITPVETDAYFTAVTLQVTDNMPGDGASGISYELSIDGGDTWVTITHWDIVKRYPLDNNGDPITSTDISVDGVMITDSWTPGSPETTYRSVRIDFSGMNLSGDQLIWRANFTSDNEAHQPAIVDVQLDAGVATHGEVSRSTPIIQGNLLFDASYETPASSWTDKSLRGHLRAMRIYDPVDTTATDYIELWDAATELQSKEPSARVIKYPQMTITTVTDEFLGTGDGTTRTFSGTLASHPVLATTVNITDNRETFEDLYINDLIGSLSQGATGSINRYTGEYTVTFNEAPGNNVAITASYSSYVLTGNLLNFTRANTPDSVLAIDDSYLNGSGYDYDFDNDNDFDSNDGNWLVNWTRGYADGATTRKEGILGPIDHSTPAVVTPPGKPAWYYGTSITLPERTAYDSFRTGNADRRTIAVVGSRDGMLHAFDTGAFRWGDNPKTIAVIEKRGYYLWPDASVSNYADVQSWWITYLASLSSTDPPYFRWQDLGLAAPDYGTGEELWAFIPANLLPRLKNNVLNGEDRAYVDASPAVADVYIDADDDGDKEWRTVILSAEGNGGDTIFCLDVTDTSVPAFLWEFSDPELFRSRSSPAVAVIGRIFDISTAETKWVAFFVSGRNYDPNAYPSVYMVDIDTGTVLEQIVLDSIEAGKGGVPSGQPSIVDSDGNGYIDRAYIGTDKGYLYKINLPDNPNSADHLSTVLVNVDFTDEDGETVDPNQRYHPIYGSPSVVVDNGLTSTGAIDYNVRIFFGTGDSPYYDEDIDTGNTTYQFLAYNDKAGKGVTSNTPIRLEWFFELPAGHRIFASAFAAAGQIYFGTATGETEDPCEGPNEGRIYAFTYEGASVINDDLGNAGMEVGDMYTAPTVEDEHLYIRTPDGIRSFGDGEYNNDIKKGGLPSTDMTYWREIF